MKFQVSQVSKVLWALALTVAPLAHAGPAAPSPSFLQEVSGYLSMTSGLALYSFDKDSAGTPTCYAKCAEIWPPVLLTDAEIAELSGVIGYVERTTGLKQLTVGGRPVYLYFKDRKEGDLHGDGVNGVWHAVSLSH